MPFGSLDDLAMHPLIRVGLPAAASGIIAGRQVDTTGYYWMEWVH